MKTIFLFSIITEYSEKSTPVMIRGGTFLESLDVYKILPSNPFTDSEFQIGKNQRYQRIFLQLFCLLGSVGTEGNTVKNALKFVREQTNLRALKSVDIILWQKGNGINWVSLSRFSRFFRFRRLKNPVISRLFRLPQSRSTLFPLNRADGLGGQI